MVNRCTARLFESTIATAWSSRAQSSPAVTPSDSSSGRCAGGSTSVMVTALLGKVDTRGRTGRRRVAAAGLLTDPRSMALSPVDGQHDPSSHRPRGSQGGHRGVSANRAVTGGPRVHQRRIARHRQRTGWPVSANYPAPGCPQRCAPRAAPGLRAAGGRRGAMRITLDAWEGPGRTLAQPKPVAYKVVATSIGTTSRNFTVSMNCRKRASFPSRMSQTWTTPRSSRFPVTFPVPV